MRLVVQRVSSAGVSVDGKPVAEIGEGLLVLVGVGQEDTQASASRLASKVAALRIFSDEAGKMNLSIRDVAGEALVVSQFTLYGDARKGNRPSFVSAADPDRATRMVDAFVSELVASGVPAKQGVFGADMDVQLVNKGPVTILLEG